MSRLLGGTMKGRVLTASVALFFSLAGTSIAAPRLSVRRAERVLLRYAKLDGAQSARVSDCSRTGRLRIHCRLQETVVSYTWELDGTPLLAHDSFCYTVIRKAPRRFVVASPIFEPVRIRLR